MDIPFSPSLVDYVTRLTDAYKVTKFISGKPTIVKDYKVVLIYLPLVLPLTKKWCVFEGPLEDPKVIASLFNLHLLANLCTLALI